MSELTKSVVLTFTKDEWQTLEVEANKVGLSVEEYLEDVVKFDMYGDHQYERAS